ncbi:MAG TPA: Gfo/Idh/MocA family oxidoreductase [Candidatus Acidoferrales bacterium]|nr:Gfo/Idh/MocA family oxidoreductase [Candidatus Acidoferrales bacterium]
MSQIHGAIPKQQMKVLVIGCGSIGRRHAQNLRELGVDDLVLYDADRDRSKSVARELQVRWVRNLDRGYQEQPDAVLICVPTSLHLELATEALEHNCHLFIEKPISHSMAGVDEFLEEVENRNRVLLVGYNFRFDPLVQTAREWVAQGRAGRVVSARFHFGSHLPARHPWEDYRAGYGARKNLGGGVILDAIHELDLALWMFGEPETTYCAGGKYSDLEIDVEDVAEILLCYPDKIASIHLDSVQRAPERYCEIIGTRGQIRADFFARTLRYFDGDTRVWQSGGGYCAIDEIYKLEMRHFLDCLHGRATPAVNGKTAAQSLKLAEDVRQSMERNLPVSPSRMTAMVASR